MREAKIACRAARSRAFACCAFTSRLISASSAFTAAFSLFRPTCACDTAVESWATWVVMLVSVAVFFARAALVEASCAVRAPCWAISALRAFCWAASCAASAFCWARASSRGSPRTGPACAKPRPTIRRGMVSRMPSRARQERVRCVGAGECSMYDLLSSARSRVSASAADATPHSQLNEGGVCRPRGAATGEWGNAASIGGPCDIEMHPRHGHEFAQEEAATNQ